MAVTGRASRHATRPGRQFLRRAGPLLPFFFQAEDGIRAATVTGVQPCALPIYALVDYACWGGVIPQSIDRLAELKEGGVIGVKAFLCDSGLPEYPPLDSFTLLDAMQRCAELELLLALHAEDADATHRLGETARAAGRTDPLAWAQSRPQRSS